EYLSPEGSRILDRLGVLKAVEAAGARPLRGMRIVAPDGTALVGDYPRSGRWRGYRDHALAVRRLAFDAVLVERARALPVAARRAAGGEGAGAPGVGGGGGGVAGGEGIGRGAAGRGGRTDARLVVGADGRASVIARRLGLVQPHRWLHRMAFMTHADGVVHDP